MLPDRPATLYVYGLPENLRYSLVRCPQWQAGSDLLADAKVPGMWSRRLRGWTVRTERIGDLLAYAEINGCRTVMKGALR